MTIICSQCASFQRYQPSKANEVFNSIFYLAMYKKQHLFMPSQCLWKRQCFSIFFNFRFFDPPTGNVGGIFGRPFSFFSPAAREGKVEPQIVAVGCPAHLSNVASGQTIMISNSQTFKAQNSGKTGASHRPEKRRRPGCLLVFLATSHGGRQRKHLSQVAPYGRKWARIK